MVDDQGNVIDPRYPRRPIRTSFNSNVINPYNLSGRIAPGYSRPQNAPYGYSQYGEPYSAIDRIGVYMDPYMGNLQAGGPQSRPRSAWGSPLPTPAGTTTGRTQYYTTPSGGTIGIAPTTDPAKLALRARMLGRQGYTSPLTAEQKQQDYQANYALGYGQPSLAPQYAPPSTAIQALGYDTPRVYQGVTNPPPAPGLAQFLNDYATPGAAILAGAKALQQPVTNLANSFWNSYLNSKNQLATYGASTDYGY